MRIIHLVLISLSIQLFCLTSCQKDNKQTLPNLTIANVNATADNLNQTNTTAVSLKLSEAATQAVEVAYATSDGTAKATKNYEAVSGTITFQPGETTKTINLQLFPDTVEVTDKSFYVSFSNVVNAKLMTNKATVTIANYFTPYNFPRMTIAWQDEFTGSSLNGSWNFETGGGGWGNNELETYTSANTSVSNGILSINALYDGTSYTSARITTQGTKEFTYGRFDIRAKLPQGQGIWPALWMLGSNIGSVGWPACGEVDIMELLGNNPAKVYGTVHYNNNGHQQKGGNFSLSGTDFASGFHTFTLIWQPDYMQWYIDYQKYFEVSTASIVGFPNDLPQFFIFNVAVGGNWPGNPDGSTVFPQSMQVDYIRVYQ